MSEHQRSERNRRLAADILAGRSPLDDAMLRTLRANAVVDLDVPPPRVLQLIDEVERLRKQVAVLTEEKRQLVVLCEAIGAKARSGEIPRFWESSASG